MDAAVTHRDRRRAPRRAPHAAEPLSRVRVRAGRELSVVNVSSGGVLVEGDARLLPGTHLEVHVIAASGRTLVRSRVTRAYVAELSSERKAALRDRLRRRLLGNGPDRTIEIPARAWAAKGTVPLP